MSTLSEKLRKKAKGIKRELIFSDIALLILGLIMVIFPEQSGDIICIAIGIILSVWGIIRLISYFTADKTVTFGSFALVQGAALLGFGIFFIANPAMLNAFLSVALAIVLIVSGIMKLQYAVDFIRLKAKYWWVSLSGAVVAIVLGIIIFVNPTVSWLMLFIGISFLVNAVWDLVSVFLLSSALKKVEKADMIDIDFTDK